VIKEIIRYKYKNIFICDAFALLTVFFAKYLKNPASSKNIESKVIEKNKANILIGFILPLENKLFPSEFIFNDPVTNKRILAINGAIQNVDIFIPFIVILGLKIMQEIIIRQVNIETIIANIKSPRNKITQLK
jgi:hypothetical protein